VLDIRHGVHVLGTQDLEAFLELTGRDPVVNVFAEHRARTTNLDPRWLGGEVWGRFADGELVAACHAGANLVPVQASPEDAAVFAERAVTRGRTASTVVGLHDAVAAFWEVAARGWGPPRDARWRQPHLESSDPPAVEPDPEVRRTVQEDFEALYPACVAMYAEEVGVSPEVGSGGDLYRARVRQLVSRGWSFARIEDGRVVFKAEVACATAHAAQIQGVYVPEDRRGEGLASSGMAAVVELVRAEIAPVVSLYVNEWNAPARRAYERAGFTESARFSTIMF
jgi:predicted GNAT family acetyltransferase